MSDSSLVIRRRDFLRTAAVAPLWPAGASAAAPAPEWMVLIRAYGNILYETRAWGAPEGASRIPLEPGHIEGWMEDCAKHGITTVLWRANCAGSLTYPSKFAGLAGEPPLPDINRGMGIAAVKQGWLVEDWKYLGEQCRRFNTLKVAAEAARRRKLQFLLDFSTFDMVGSWCTKTDWPAGGSRAFDPDWWLWSKDQQTRLAGIPFYGNSVLRAGRLGEIAEALDYGIDGVSLGFFSHVDAMAGETRCSFGYNPEAVRDYKQRYRTDPLSGTVDPHRFYALHGEYYTQFVREAAKLVHGRGKKLLANTRVDGIHGWGDAECGRFQLSVMGRRDLRDGKSDLPFAGALYLEWEKWANEGLVDGLIFWAPFEGGAAAVEELKKRVKTPAYLFRKLQSDKGKVRPPHTLEGYRQDVAAVRAGAIDGYYMHTTIFLAHEWFNPTWRDIMRLS